MAEKNKKVVKTPKNNNILITSKYSNYNDNDLNKRNRYITTEKLNPKRQSRFFERKEINRSPKNKNKENDMDIKKQKSYTYRSIGRFGNSFLENKNRNRIFNYRNNNNYNEIENIESNNEIQDVPRPSSVKKIKKKHRHHRHHHYQHFKRPKRIINISKLDSFSIIQYN